MKQESEAQPFGSAGVRWRGAATLAKVLVLLSLLVACVSCSENRCDLGPCRGSASCPQMKGHPSIQAAASGHAPVDTTYITVSCEYSPSIPQGFRWKVPFGTAGPAVRESHEICAAGSTGGCTQWRVQEAIPWCPPSSDELLMGDLQIDFPDCDTSCCVATRREWQFSLAACGGHGVMPFIVWSRPAGATILLDGADTGLRTRAILCIREFSKGHTVRVELDGYKPESTLVAPSPLPCCLDSVVFTLKPAGDSNVRRADST